MADDPLYTDARLARFYGLDNGWTEDREFCLRLARGRAFVLDLGCGTGALALRIAAETAAMVTGLDPAAAMLDIARAKPGADRADGQEFRANACIALPKRVELARQIAAVGLKAEQWFGDWIGAPLHAESPDFIPLGRLA